MSGDEYDIFLDQNQGNKVIKTLPFEKAQLDKCLGSLSPIQQKELLERLCLDD